MKDHSGRNVPQAYRAMFRHPARLRNQSHELAKNVYLKSKIGTVTE